MPLYEYECTACKRHTEKIQKFSDPEITVCPHCGGTLERVLSAPAISFKGGGWYSDLYSSAKPMAASGDSTKATTTPSDSGGSSGGAKESPATAAPSAPATAPAATPASTTTKP